MRSLRLRARVALFVALAFAPGCTGGGGGGSRGGASIAPATSQTSGTTPTSTTPAPVSSSTTTPPVAGFAAAASLVQPRGLHTATLLDDGRVLVVGGLSTSSAGPAYLTESELYDPVANTSTKASDPSLGGNPGGYMIAGMGATSFPVVRYLHVAAKLSDGRVLICGGHGVEAIDAQGNPIDSDLASAYTFDPKKNTFTAVGSLVAARSSASAVTLASGQVLVAGGFNATLNTNQGGSTMEAELFDPTKNAFAATGSLSVARERAAAAFVGGSAIFAGGLTDVVPQGGTAPSQFLATGAEVWNATTGMFATGPQPLSDRAGATLDAISATDAILAGGDGLNGGVLAIERLSSGVWTKVATLPAEREKHASAAVSGTVLLAGGVQFDATGNMVTLATADFFDGSNNTVTSFTMAHQRNGAAAVALPSGAVLVIGGFENGKTDPLGLDGSPVAPVEVFTKPVAGAAAPTPAPGTSPAPAPSPSPSPSPAPAGPALSYATDVAPILNANCIGCHNGNNQNSLKTYADVLVFVMPANSARSSLVTRTQPGGNMAKYLATAAQATTIKTWVDQGAKP